MQDASQASAGLPWLVRLRWLTLAGQFLALLAAKMLDFGQVSWAVAASVVAAGALSNLGLYFGWVNAARTRRHTARGKKLTGTSLLTRVMGAALTLDVLLLTALLAASGGPNNPFTILYLVQIVLAALVLDARWTGWVTSCSAVGFAFLFLFGVGPHALHIGHDAHTSHLQGMWIAFAVTAAILAYFVRRISLTFGQQREEIARLRHKTTRAAHLASLTALAAGAAHELRTPLGTIAVAAHELRVADPHRRPEEQSDIELIETEVERCQSILASLGPRFASRLGKLERLDVRTVLDTLAREFTERSKPAFPRARIEVSPPSRDYYVECTRTELLSALRGLVTNAVDALESPDDRVTVSAKEELGFVCFAVEDTGTGMSHDVLRRAVEPFYTSKEVGQGQGLGLFVTNAFALSVGGELRLESTRGQGTTARLLIPIASKKEDKVA